MKRLTQIDTNLLVALDVLLEELHVTRAAERIGVSQPAMSQMLQRLRDALGDPLLTRSAGKMLPTPRALAMQTPLRNALRALDTALTDINDFDPTTAKRVFRVACYDTYAFSAIPRLMNRVANAGAGLEIDVLALPTDQGVMDLRNGDLDLTIFDWRTPPTDIHYGRFVLERMMSLVRNDHPILKEELTPEAYVRWPHVVFRTTGTGTFAIDTRLETLGYKRRIAGRTAYFLSAPTIVQGSDLIVTVPRSAATEFAKHWPVTIFEPPLGGPMQYWTQLAWANFMEADPGHLWLRKTLFEIGAEMQGIHAAQKQR